MLYLDTGLEHQQHRGSAPLPGTCVSPHHRAACQRFCSQPATAAPLARHNQKGTCFTISRSSSMRHRNKRCYHCMGCLLPECEVIGKKGAYSKACCTEVNRSRRLLLTVNLVMIGLLNKAYPDGCQHRFTNPAETKALPHEGASFLSFFVDAAGLLCDSTLLVWWCR